MRLHEAIQIEPLMEVRIITPYETEPLRDNDTVRVYHGSSDMATIFSALTRGLSGNERIARKYSYEANNNPRGLFVTPDLRTAKEFGDYVIEIHSRVSDLEAPVWPGGSFAGQGQYAGMFNDPGERGQAAITQRTQLKANSPDEFVRMSDRPDVAFWLMASGERQALFTGDLNANSIRAIWISRDPTRVGQTYDRLDPREFVKIFTRDGVPNRFGSRTTPGDLKDEELMRTVSNRVVDPRDEVTGEMIVSALHPKYGRMGGSMTPSKILDILKRNPEYVRQLVWSDRQFNQAMRDIQRMRI